MIPAMPERLDEARATLRDVGQEHLLRFADELSPERLAQLLDQVESVRWTALSRLIETHVRAAPPAEVPAGVEPAPYFGADPASSPVPYDAAAAREAGEQLVREGRVAAFTVAGGQGTRLGWNGPKGTFPATVVTGKPLFRCFAEQIIAAERKYGTTIPWFIMTSPLNDAATRSFFHDNNCFGLVRSRIFMFPQGVMPSIELATGLVLLAAKDEIALNPDGHGGALRAMRSSGALEAMRAHGIEHISYFQVDNPLARVIDPLFIGLHATAPESSGELSSKMVPKAYPGEKMGVFVRATEGPHAGRTMVIEYSDLPGALAEARAPDGSLRFVAGSIAIHLLARAMAERLTDGDEVGLPWHRAVKKVPHVDLERGELVEPETENAVKLETFFFDALPLAAGSIVLETDRIEEFAPIKNADGIDSPATSHRLQSDRAGRWLALYGVAVPQDSEGHVDASIEIGPLTATEATDLKSARLPMSVERGAEIVL